MALALGLGEVFFIFLSFDELLFSYRYNKLREKFPPTSFSGRPTLSEAGFDLLNKLLTYDPEKVSIEIVKSVSY